MYLTATRLACFVRWRTTFVFFATLKMLASAFTPLAFFQKGVLTYLVPYPTPPRKGAGQGAAPAATALHDIAPPLVAAGTKPSRAAGGAGGASAPPDGNGSVTRASNARS